MKTSIYIPVDYTCMSRLIEIVSVYNNAKVSPDEIIINAFGIEDENSLNILREIQSLGHTNTTIYARKTNGSMSDNRNYAKSLTKNDIVLFNDAMVCPSMKRVEEIKKYFEHTNTMIAHHLSYHYDVFFGHNVNVPDFGVIPSSDVYNRYYPFGVVGEPWMHTRTYGQEFGANGLDINSVCVRREVLDDVVWKNSYECELYQGRSNGDGYEFALETLYKYNRSDILNIPLTIV